jgi:hypothetical protein
MDTDTYVDVLNRRVRQSRKYLGIDERKFIFQQDNARTHTALRSMNFFARHRIKVLIWPPDSPDLNLMNTFGYTSNESSISTQSRQETSTNCGDVWRRAGGRFQWTTLTSCTRACPTAWLWWFRTKDAAPSTDDRG